MNSTHNFKSTTLQSQSILGKDVLSKTLTESDKGLTLTEETRSSVKGAMPGTSANSEKHHVESKSVTLTKDGKLIEEKHSSYESQDIGAGKGKGPGLGNSPVVEKVSVIHTESNSKTASSSDKAEFMAKVNEFNAQSTQAVDSKNATVIFKQGSTTPTENGSTSVVQSMDSKGNKQVSLSVQENVGEGRVKYSQLDSKMDAKGNVSERHSDGVSQSKQLPNGDLQVQTQEKFDELRGNTAQAKAAFNNTFEGASAMLDTSHAPAQAAAAGIAAKMAHSMENER